MEIHYSERVAAAEEAAERCDPDLELLLLLELVARELDRLWECLLWGPLESLYRGADALTVAARFARGVWSELPSGGALVARARSLLAVLRQVGS
jgi:hypothetical protein